MGSPASLILEQLKKLGVSYIVTLPDKWTEELLTLARSDGDLVHVPVSREDEGVGICAGLYLAGKGAALVIQNSGLLLSCNAIKSLALKYRIPIFIMVSNRGSLEESAPYHIAVGQGLVTRPVLDALGVPSVEVTTLAEVSKITEAYRFCRISEQPVAVILGKEALVSTVQA